MKYTKDLKTKNKAKFEIVLDAKDWEAQLEKAYQKSKGKYSVQGFRKGKVPRSVLEKQYGEGVFYEDAINEAFYEYYNEVLNKETDIEPIAQPEIDIKGLSKEGVTLLVEVEIKPEVKLGKYTGLEVSKKANTVSAKEVQAELLLVAEGAAKMVEVKGRAAKDGDNATIDFSGSVDGVKFDGGTAEKYAVKIGSKTFIEGFEDQVIGMKVGETKDINVTFPKNYQAENLKGKPAVFEVKLHKIEEKVMPELNDEFAKNNSEFDTLADMKKDIKSTLKAKNEENITIGAENDLIEKIVETTEVELSEKLVDEQAEAFIKEFEYKLMYQGARLEDYLSHMEMTREQLKESRLEDAKKTAKTKLVLEAIVKAEKMTVTKEEIDEAVKAMSKKAGQKYETFAKNLREDVLDNIVNDIVIQKLLTFLRENNNIK